MFEKGKRTIVMSATILDIDTFCDYVGLDRNSVKYIAANSDFPVENRKIKLLNTVRMNWETLKEDVVQQGIAATIDVLMDAHHDQKGIIHCTSYPQTQFIEKYLSSKNKRRLIFTDPNIPRDDILKKHFESKDPTVLISPSLHTGLDLKDDLSRFQIIVKTPYGDLNDRWVSAKKNKNNNWYYWRACVRLVQAYGRSIRSKTDYADTYILDKSINDFLNRNRSRLPDWFKEAIY
jgi:Rad3-related DNA helicase